MKNLKRSRLKTPIYMGANNILPRVLCCCLDEVCAVAQLVTPGLQLVSCPQYHALLGVDSASIGLNTDRDIGLSTNNSYLTTVNMLRSINF
jgi:hypothetical protein